MYFSLNSEGLFTLFSIAVRKNLLPLDEFGYGAVDVSLLDDLIVCFEINSRLYYPSSSLFLDMAYCGCGQTN